MKRKSCYLTGSASNEKGCGNYSINAEWGIGTYAIYPKGHKPIKGFSLIPFIAIKKYEKLLKKYGIK